MQRTVLALPLAALSLVCWLTPQALAQDTKSARGTVTAMSANSMTVKAASGDMKFTVDAKTVVTVEGGSTASRAAAATGKPGPTLSELVKVGDNVEVGYHDVNGAMHAARVRRVASAGGGGGSSSAKTDTASGTVDAVSASSLTITGSSGGGATFKQTFTIDGETKVVGVGAGTAAAAKGGKIAITDLVGKGDRVSVTYHLMGAANHAAEVRVTSKMK